MFVLSRGVDRLTEAGRASIDHIREIPDRAILLFRPHQYTKMLVSSRPPPHFVDVSSPASM